MTTDIVNKVEQALEKVRPYLRADGGDIVLVEVTDNMVAKVRLTGACSGCPYSMMTMKSGVEQAILNEVPEIKEVVAVE